ncbi:UDP-N-acetylmuramate dehydrogenase [bacterium]|nr:UDP-N-acetylmuramate dehydrogenase [bacterium]
MREWLQQRFGPRVRYAEPLSRHTSFRIGGPADAWVEVGSAEEILALQRRGRAEGIPVSVLGIGTNVLVADRGVRGIVLKLGRALGVFDWRQTGDRWQVRAGAAAPFKKLVMEAAARGLTGLEFAEGIPGSLGGGLLMNAGAFGGEISQCVSAIEVVDPAHGVRELPRAALRFGYRRFDLPPDHIVTRIDFALTAGDPEAIRAAMASAKRKRDSKQPLGFPNAGSVFKNPPGEFAGRLIEAAGLKGRRVGGAMISERHANFIVNVGDATAADVKALIDEVTDTVWRARAIRLVPEIKLIGDWEGRE